MTYHAYTSGICPKEIGGQTINWSLILGMLPQTKSLPYNEISSRAYAVARLMKGVGTAVKTKYSPTSSSSTINRANNCLKAYGGFYGAKVIGFNNDLVTEMVLKKLPVLIRGRNADDVGHDWVIDGAIRYSRTMTGYDPKIKQRFSRLVYEKLIHCNFGWGGASNGFYAGDIFDPSAGTVEEKELTRSDHPEAFTHGRKILYYEGVRK